MKTYLTCAVASGFAAVLTITVGAAVRPQQPPGTQPRFDELVRSDFFAGVAGDAVAMDRAIRFIEQTLEKEPGRTDVLVWHGAGLVTRASKAFEQGDQVKGTDLWRRGLQEMNDAAARDPENVAVRIPRGAVLLEVSRSFPDPVEAKALLATGVADYEKVLALQAPYFKYLSDHAQGELLFGLAEGLHRLGDRARARMYFERLTSEVKDSTYGKMADAWLKDPTGATARPSGCASCHKK